MISKLTSIGPIALDWLQVFLGSLDSGRALQKLVRDCSELLLATCVLAVTDEIHIELSCFDVVLECRVERSGELELRRSSAQILQAD